MLPSIVCTLIIVELNNLNYNEMKQMNLNHEMVAHHFKGKPEFINYYRYNDTALAVYKFQDTKYIKFSDIKPYLGIYKLDGKFIYIQLTNIKNLKVYNFGQNTKQKSFGTRGITGRKPKVKKRKQTPPKRK